MSNIKKVRYYAGFIDAQRNWLNKMASKGYRLVKCGRLIYEFETCEPSEYIYQIDYIGDKSKAEGKDYAAFLEDMGYSLEEKERRSKKEIIDSFLPICVDKTGKNFWMMGNVTCAAAAVSSKKLIKKELFYEWMNR